MFESIYNFVFYKNIEKEKEYKELLNEINIKLDKILLHQCNTTKTIDKIDDKLIKDTVFIQDSLDNMNTHISFIENVYDTIKLPFYFILNTISKIDIPEKQILLKNE
jgi:hypothetical protein